MPKSTVRLRFYSDDENPVDIYGVVESCVAPLFTAEPEATISLLCHKPDFYEPTPIVVNGNTVSTNTEFQINYEGSIETGIKVSLTLNRDLFEFVIYHRASDNSLSTLRFTENLLAGDVITINTAAGEKAATLTRAGSNSSLLYAIDPMSSWITLWPGLNYIRVYAEGAAVPFKIEYNNKIGGL
jgi:hypothetical protein